MGLFDRNKPWEHLAGSDLVAVRSRLHETMRRLGIYQFKLEKAIDENLGIPQHVHISLVEAGFENMKGDECRDFILMRLTRARMALSEVYWELDGLSVLAHLPRHNDKVKMEERFQKVPGGPDRPGFPPCMLRLSRSVHHVAFRKIFAPG